MISGLSSIVSPPIGPAPAFAASRAGEASPVAGTDFSSMLASVAASAGNTLRQAEDAAVAGIAGELSPQQVVTKVMAAEHTLQAAIAIRDKLVGAYLEISRMQI